MPGKHSRLPRPSQTPAATHPFPIMFRFIHSADWQLGARFTGFGRAGEPLREARLTTLRRALDLASQRQCNAFLIAGDLFEDNEIEDSLVETTVDCFRRHPSLPVYVLPGNHDPETGPGSVWNRRSFRTAPPHVHVLREAGFRDLAPGVRLFASPLHQKVSTVDPSAVLAQLTAGAKGSGLNLGITHGAPAIEGRHQPNDFPIALNAATRAGLDYLALGHWHSWLDTLDSGRMVMPGTPEPDRFQSSGGAVALVELGSQGQPPVIQRIPVASLNWQDFSLDVANPDLSRTTLQSALASGGFPLNRSVVRVTLRGTTTPGIIAGLREWAGNLLASCLAGRIEDRSSILLTPAELQDLERRHPILAQVLADLDQLESLAGQDSMAAMRAAPDREPATPQHRQPLDRTEVAQLLQAARIDLQKLPPGAFGRIRQALHEALREVGQ